MMLDEVYYVPTSVAWGAHFRQIRLSFCVQALIGPRSKK